MRTSPIVLNHASVYGLANGVVKPGFQLRFVGQLVTLTFEASEAARSDALVQCAVFHFGPLSLGWFSFPAKLKR